MTLILEFPESKEAAINARSRAQSISAEQYVMQVLDRDLASSEVILSVMERMRALRSNIKPDPEGWTTRDYVQYGYHALA